MIGIYKITNNINGKVYIGQSLDVEKRLEKHRNRTQNRHLKSAFDKYGKENFSFEPLFIIKDIDKKDEIKKILDEKEKEFILLYEATNREKGYNVEEGGFKGWHHTEETKKILREKRALQVISEETRKKMSLSNKGRFVSEKTREKLSKALKGREISEETRKKISDTLKNRTDREISEETREKLSKAGIGRKHTLETKKKISMNNPAKKEEIKQKISKATKGRIVSEETKQKIREKRALQNMKETKKVICIETGQIFSSVKEAGEVFNMNYKNIRMCCNGHKTSSGGYTWKYLCDGDKE